MLDTMPGALGDTEETQNSGRRSRGPPLSCQEEETGTKITVSRKNREVPQERQELECSWGSSRVEPDPCTFLVLPVQRILVIEHQSCTAS